MVIDSTLDPGGSLTYGELFLPATAGTGAGEVLVSCHVCHPSLANDNLSGLAVTLSLARELAGVERRHGWRFVFDPGDDRRDHLAGDKPRSRRPDRRRPRRRQPRRSRAASTTSGAGAATR